MLDDDWGTALAAFIIVAGTLFLLGNLFDEEYERNQASDGHGYCRDTAFAREYQVIWLDPQTLQDGTVIEGFYQACIGEGVRGQPIKAREKVTYTIKEAQND